MTSEREIRLECAAFLDSSRATRLPFPRPDARVIVERFLATAYDELGKAPHLLEGEDMAEILRERLPAHFGKRDPLAEQVEEVLGAFLEHLGERAVVLHAFELARALGDHAPAFRERVASGELAGKAPAKKTAPFVHRAEKTGRNDPCPCGSGKKFKQCCRKIG
jgi:preprotein translocase subunit SecA